MKETKKIVMASFFAILVCIATMVIKVPSPVKGYLNLGDCVVLMSGWLLSPAYGFLAAGIGSMLADMFLGYVIYMPATFIIKGIMAIIAFYSYRLIGKKFNMVFGGAISGFLAEIFMIFAYFMYEGFLYGFGASLLNVPASVAQGFIGIILGVLLLKLTKRISFK